MTTVPLRPLRPFLAKAKHYGDSTEWVLIRYEWHNMSGKYIARNPTTAYLTHEMPISRILSFTQWPVVDLVGEFRSPIYSTYICSPYIHFFLMAISLRSREHEMTIETPLQYASEFEKNSDKASFLQTSYVMEDADDMSKHCCHRWPWRSLMFRTFLPVLGRFALVIAVKWSFVPSCPYGPMGMSYCCRLFVPSCPTGADGHES